MANKHLALMLFAFIFSIEGFAKDAVSCDKFFRFDGGFRVADDGRISLRVGESKYKAVEDSINGLAQLMLGRALKLDELSQVAKRYLEDKSEDPYFVKLAKAYSLSVKIDNQTEFTKKIPATGPVLVLMNHPANGRETVAVAAAISLIRPDTKVALTYLLRDFPGMSDNAIFLNPSPSPEAKLYNKGQREQMDQFLKNGGVLLAHASGEVSTLRYSSDGEYAKDPAWRAGIGKLIQDNPDVQILPIFLDGQASPTFQKVRGIYPAIIGDAIGPIFHVRELVNGQNHVFPMNVGNVIKGTEALANGDGDIMKMMAYLRARTYALKGRFEKKADERKLEPIALKTPENLVQIEIDSMKLLTEEKGLQVRIAQGKDIPNVLRELGRLREVAFRTVGEASGKSLDVDLYDQHYHHVVMYKPDTNVIIGAYRIAFVDKVIEQIGLDGLYNRTLFDYSQLVLSAFPKSIELGRAFVNAELADRDRRSAIYFLPLIWKAIAKILEENPEYTHLTGPVSISNQYSDVSKSLMMIYLKQKYGSEYSGLVNARNPFRPRSAVLAEGFSLIPTIKSLKDLNALVSEIDGVGIPSLITSYDKLGARYLSFNFDPDFNSVDGLIVVNLLTADRAEMAKYFGAESLQRYLDFHGLKP